MFSNIRSFITGAETVMGIKDSGAFVSGICFNIVGPIGYDANLEKKEESRHLYI
jgi:hypothetical protein